MEMSQQKGLNVQRPYWRGI